LNIKYIWNIQLY